MLTSILLGLIVLQFYYFRRKIQLESEARKTDFCDIFKFTQNHVKTIASKQVDLIESMIIKLTDIVKKWNEIEPRLCHLEYVNPTKNEQNYIEAVLSAMNTLLERELKVNRDAYDTSLKEIEQRKSRGGEPESTYATAREGAKKSYVISLYKTYADFQTITRYLPNYKHMLYSVFPFQFKFGYSNEYNPNKNGKLFFSYTREKIYQIDRFIYGKKPTEEELKKLGRSLPEIYGVKNDLPVEFNSYLISDDIHFRYLS